MCDIYKVATITSKCRITLPKPILKALGVSIGDKVVFERRGSEVFMMRANDTEHRDPIIEAFLGVLEHDLRNGKHIRALPDTLAKEMLANLRNARSMGEEIEGEVAL